MKAARSALLLLLLAVGNGPVFGGGGGENMLLIVNPSDEPSLRIADAYVKARNIPIRNILYIDPNNGRGEIINISEGSFLSIYMTAIPDAIASRGLGNQIDYIGTIGQPHAISGNVPVNYLIGFNAVLNHVTQIQNGMIPYGVMYRPSELVQDVPPSSTFIPYSYTKGSNPAIYHSQFWGPSSAQWYMSGAIGYAGVRGLNPNQAVESLQRTVKADGTNPLGAIYFEDSQEIRTGARSSSWPPIQGYLDKVGIPWVKEYGITAKNRSNVRGSVVGSATPTVATQFVNGSAYLPGSYADDLTSFAGSYGVGSSQTVVSNFLLGGAGATAGSVNEPMADQVRFTYSSVFVFSQDGSTLGEAFYKSLKQPDLMILQGDILSQAYADVPEVAFTAGPADGAMVSGMVSLSGSAHLNSMRTATGIARLRLFVDGLQYGLTLNGESGSFNLDTTTLSDGVHEVRIVAYNDSQAASEGCVLRQVVVNNQGQSVSITGSNRLNAAWNQTLSVPVTSSQGSGPAIAGVQLQLLGRVVGSISASSGNVSLDVTKLAYGNNTVTPVAVLASGSQQVQGAPVTVMRQFQQFPGSVPTPLDRRNPGCDFSYFGNAVGGTSTLDTINFNATPSQTLHSLSMSISPEDTYRPENRNMPEAYHVGGYYANGLAIMSKCRFTVTTAGEYLFSPSFGAYTSAGVFIDGTAVVKMDSPANVYVPARSIYLLPGEHELVVKLGENRSGRNAYETSFSLVMRGPDGNSNWVAGSSFYTVK